jgi:hypothetical protein
MKVNIVTDNPYSDRQGYTIANKDNIDDVVCDAEATEILALGVLDKYSLTDIPKIVDVFVRKLRHGGSITLDCIDLAELLKSVLNGELTLSEINNFTHGGNRKSVLNVNFLSDLLKERGLRITLLRLENLHGIVKAERP